MDLIASSLGKWGLRPRSNVLNISLNNTEHLLSAKCSERLTTLLSLVHPCWVLFSEVWSRSNFSLNKCWATQHFLCFSRCWVLFSTFDQSLNICSVRACAVGDVSTKFSLVQQNVQHLWSPSNWTSLNNTKLCWINVQWCSVKMFSTFDRGLRYSLPRHWRKRKMIKTCYMRFPVFTTEHWGHVFLFFFYFGC